jgi:UDP-4-amino-4-deoxy-L-arabinose-oxoglutarate aminotransferase
MNVREEFLPFSRPSIGEREVAEVTACLRSGWITTGPRCLELEARFRERTGARCAVSLTSATAGMHLILLALGIGPGDEVITPSMTFASTVNQIVLAGAAPVFVDVDYDTLNLKVGQVEERITPRTKAVIPVHFAGAPADMDLLMEVARRRGIAVIEDAAHAVGTTYRGIHAGGFGNPAIFSFHPIKNMTTGEGGMVTLDDEALERKIRLLRFHGIERDAWKRYGKGGDPSYDIREPGFKYNLTDLQAALGVVQLDRVEEFNARRRFLVDLYRERLAGIGGLDLPGVPDYPHGHPWHLFVVKVSAPSRERFMEGLAERNIGYGLHFPAVHRLAFVRERFGDASSRLPETERAADRILSLPLYPDLTEEDIAYVCDAVREILCR